ncbi:MAG: HNH endonuclease [Actinobacteria bacterium]|nr:HNH endonuclease [Actinomycetota bacterium]
MRVIRMVDQGDIAGALERLGYSILADPVAEWDWISEPHQAMWMAMSILAIPRQRSIRWERVRDSRAWTRRHIAQLDWESRRRRKKRIGQRTRRIVISRAAGRCRYCRRFITERTLVIDHVVPVSRGGRSYLRNLVAACYPCNADKSDLLLSEWPAHLERLAAAAARAA